MRLSSSERPLLRWAPALLFTLLLHLGVGWGLRYLELFGATPPAAAEPQLVDVVFPKSSEEALRQFTELPPDRAEDPPDQADLLSNVDSRARDQELSGEGRLARQDGEVDIPQVRMDTGQPSPPAEQSTRSPQTAEARTEKEAAEEPTEEEQTEEERSEEAERPEPRTWDAEAPKAQTSAPEDPWAAFRRAAEEVTPSPNLSPSLPSLGGMSDIRQEAMAAPDENAAFPGDISLSTKEWDWAPWLLVFRRELMASWTAPLGYHLGLIHGWTLLEVVIAPTGEVLSNTVLGEEGNVAFRESSLAAIERSQPYIPLPDDFPEDTLVLRIRLGYPEWQPQPLPARPPVGRR